MLSLFFLPPPALVRWMFYVATASCLGRQDKDNRVSYGTDDWNDDADKFSLRIASEGDKEST